MQMLSNVAGWFFYAVGVGALVYVLLGVLVTVLFFSYSPIGWFYPYWVQILYWPFLLWSH